MRDPTVPATLLSPNCRGMAGACQRTTRFPEKSVPDRIRADARLLRTPSAPRSRFPQAGGAQPGSNRLLEGCSGARFGLLRASATSSIEWPDPTKKNVMAAKRAATNVVEEQPELLASREDAKQRLQDRIGKGKELMQRKVDSGEAYELFKRDTGKWDDFNTELLRRLFTTEELAREYSYASSGSMSTPI